jgi:hypothetical protein
VLTLQIGKKGTCIGSPGSRTGFGQPIAGRCIYAMLAEFRAVENARLEKPGFRDKGLARTSRTVSTPSVFSRRMNASKERPSYPNVKIRSAITGSLARFRVMPGDWKETVNSMQYAFAREPSNTIKPSHHRIVGYPVRLRV